MRVKHRNIKLKMISLLCAILAAKIYVFSNYKVIGISMMPTLYNNDLLLINKIAYDIGTLERFDLVVFQNSENEYMVKRIIGLPSESIHYENNVLYINNQAIKEPYIDEKNNLTKDFTLYEVTEKNLVPDNMVFVLGDNRLHSEDSRILGFIPIEKIVGKVSLKYWPKIKYF